MSVNSIATRSTSLALLVSLAGCVSAPPSRADLPKAVSIETQPIGDLCTGHCPHYEVIVRADGLVRTRDSSDNEKEFSISPAEYARFNRLLAPARPTGEWRDENKSCEHQLDYDNPEWSPSVIQVDVRWDGDGMPSRLTACSIDKVATDAYIAALHYIQIDNWSGEYRPDCDLRRNLNKRGPCPELE
jgi:hypothetical protein